MFPSCNCRVPCGLSPKIRSNWYKKASGNLSRNKIIVSSSLRSRDDHPTNTPHLDASISLLPGVCFCPSAEVLHAAASDSSDTGTVTSLLCLKPSDGSHLSQRKIHCGPKGSHVTSPSHETLAASTCCPLGLERSFLASVTCPFAAFKGV